MIHPTKYGSCTYILPSGNALKSILEKNSYFYASKIYCYSAENLRAEIRMDRQELMFM